MYTSGSTGAPKGVLGTHSGLINRLVWQYVRFPYEPRSLTFEGNSDSDSTHSGESSDEAEDEAENEAEDEGGEKDGQEDGEKDQEMDELRRREGCDIETAISGASDSSAESGEGAGVDLSVSAANAEATAVPSPPFRGEVICRRTPVSPA